MMIGSMLSPNMGSKKKVVSDHNIMYCKFSILFDCAPPQIRKELFNFKSMEGQKAFFEKTSSSVELSNSFSEIRSFPHNTNIFFRELNACIHKCFKKIRIKQGGKAGKSELNNQIHEHMKLKTQLKIFLKNCNNTADKIIAQDKLDEVEKFLIDKCAADNAETVKQHISEVQREDGNFSQLKLWKL